MSEKCPHHVCLSVCLSCCLNSLNVSLHFCLKGGAFVCLSFVFILKFVGQKGSDRRKVVRKKTNKQFCEIFSCNLTEFNCSKNQNKIYTTDIEYYERGQKY